MFVILKVALFFFRPIIWIIFWLLCAVFFKNPIRRKRALVVGLALLLVFSNPFICRTVLRYYETAPVDLAPTQKYNVGILLGGFISYYLDEDKAYFNPAGDRFIQTALLYKTGHIQKILIAAGNGYLMKKPFREADLAKTHFMELGIPATDIYTDDLSINTLENAANAKKLIDSLHLSGPFLLISSAFHLPRAKGVFTKQGIQADLYPCDFLSRNKSNEFVQDNILPSSNALTNWEYLIKEWLGIAEYKLTGKG